MIRGLSDNFANLGTNKGFEQKPFRKEKVADKKVTEKNDGQMDEIKN